jgi:hypothetical protein
MNASQKITSNVSSQLNINAVENVEIANLLVNISKMNTGGNKVALETAASNIIGAANTAVTNASNAKASNQVANAVAVGKNSGVSAFDATNNMAINGLNMANGANNGKAAAKSVANAAINATGKVTNNSNVSAGVNKVLNAVVNEAAKNDAQAVNSSIKANTNAANSVLSLVNKVNSNQAQDVLLNAAAKIQNNTKKMINRIQPTNNASIQYSKVKPAGKGFLITASGNTVKQTPKNLQQMTNPKNAKMYVKFNGKNKKLTTQVYKQGQLANVYKNKKGSYTKANGMSGNVKNYLYSGMNTGLFGNKMM